MQNISTNNSFYYLIIILCLIANISFANDSYKSNLLNAPNKSTKISIGNKSNKLLDILKWNDFYEADRKKDITYLLGDIDGDSLKNLSVEQKKQVIVLMQDIAIKQMMKDKYYFRSYLVEQYNKFFTVDEADTLIQYFKTDIMQTIIDIRLKKTLISPEEIRAKLANSKEDEKKTIASMTDSYLHSRYARFQEKMSPLMQKMIVERLKVVLELTIAKIPELVEYVKTHQKTNIELNMKAQ